jgi:hypothetical protein
MRNEARIGSGCLCRPTDKLCPYNAPFDTRHLDTFGEASGSRSGVAATNRIESGRWHLLANERFLQRAW